MDEAFIRILREQAATPLATLAGEVRRVRAYAIGDPDASTDFKRIVIPDGWSYYKHSLRIWTKNPRVSEGNAESNRYWSIEDGVTRGSGPDQRVLDVWVELWASAQPLFAGRRWIGVDLSVTIVQAPPA